MEQIINPKKYSKTKNNPGNIAPANKSILLTGSGARSPEIADACSFAPWKTSAKTRTIDGGIICPSVPLAQITPVEIFYHISILSLMAMIIFPLLQQLHQQFQWMQP